MIALMPNLCKNLSSDFAGDERRIFPGGDNAGHVTNYNVKRIPGGFALTLLYPLLPHRRCRSCSSITPSSAIAPQTQSRSQAILEIEFTSTGAVDAVVLLHLSLDLAVVAICMIS
jgi:hypothetical protein